MNGRVLIRRCRPSARSPMMRMSFTTSGGDQMPKSAAAVDLASSGLPAAQTRAALRQRLAAAEVAVVAIPRLQLGEEIGSAFGAGSRRDPPAPPAGATMSGAVRRLRVPAEGADRRRAGE